MAITPVPIMLYVSDYNRGTVGNFPSPMYRHSLDSRHCPLRSDRAAKFEIHLL